MINSDKVAEGKCGEVSESEHRWFWPLGCGSACKHTALQTWWQLGQNGALNRKQNTFQLLRWKSQLHIRQTLARVFMCLTMKTSDVLLLLFVYFCAKLSYLVLIIYRNLFPRTPSPWPQTTGWLLYHSHKPEEQKEKGQRLKVLDPAGDTILPWICFHSARLMLVLHLTPWLPLLSSCLQYIWGKMAGVSLTSWYFSRAMLVSAASGVSMKISLFLWIFSRIPCKQTRAKKKQKHRTVKLNFFLYTKRWGGNNIFLTLTCSYQDATMFSM